MSKLSEKYKALLAEEQKYSPGEDKILRNIDTILRQCSEALGGIAGVKEAMENMAHLAKDASPDDAELVNDYVKRHQQKTNTAKDIIVDFRNAAQALEKKLK